MKKRKMVLKIAIIVVAILTTLIVSGFMGVGCTRGPLQGTTFDVDGWRLFRYNRSREPQSRHVAIRGLLDESLIENRVLTIPTQIGRYRIDRLNHLGALTPNIITKIIIPAEVALHTQGLQGGGGIRYIEFLCDTFENVHNFPINASYIIPDGSTENFIDRIESFGFTVSRFTFIEKSQFTGIN